MLRHLKWKTTLTTCHADDKELNRPVMVPKYLVVVGCLSMLITVCLHVTSFSFLFVTFVLLFSAFSRSDLPDIWMGNMQCLGGLYSVCVCVCVRVCVCVCVCVCV